MPDGINLKKIIQKENTSSVPEISYFQFKLLVINIIMKQLHDAISVAHTLNKEWAAASDWLEALMGRG